MRRCTVFFLTITLVSACARNRYNQAPTVPGDDPSFSAPEPIVLPGLESDPPEALKLLPGDLVQLTTVSAQTQVYDGLIVDAMGQLHVPLAGDIEVGSLSLSEAERAIERGLRRYDRFARANLIISELKGHTAAVVGAAASPGRFEAVPGMRLADLLAQAGGIKEARSNEVPTLLGSLELTRLVRGGETVPVSMRLARQGDPKHNIRVRPGDQLFVPPITDQLIMVLGAVRTPQPLGYRPGIRLMEVLAHAGGLLPGRGDRKDIRIVRGSLREPRIYTTNMKALMSGKATDVELIPGDIVYVTNTWYATTADVLNALSPILSLANSVAILGVAGAISGN
jgi:protein involved in polysaccharide export with SLBB domain